MHKELISVDHAGGLECSYALTDEINWHHLLDGAAVEVGDADVHEGHVERREDDEAAREARLLPPIVETDGRRRRLAIAAVGRRSLVLGLLLRRHLGFFFVFFPQLQLLMIAH